MASRLLAIAKRLSSGLETLQAPYLAFSVLDVLGPVCTAPLVLAGLGWLVAVTDLTLMRTAWPTFLLLLVLEFVFERFGFFLFAEVIPGTQYDWSAALGTVVTWSAALMFGPTALWLFVLQELIDRIRKWRRSPSTGMRWNILRNFTMNFVAVALAGLVALALYQRWGGAFPLPGLGLAHVLPALGATFVWSLLFGLVYGPPLIYFGGSRAYGVELTGHSREILVKWVVSFVGWRFLANPFAILAAGLYAQNGLGGYLFFVAGLFLASLLAHQLSDAVERGQQRHRELEKLEQVGRAILDAPPDASTLPDVLNEHIPPMFPYSCVEVRLFPDRIVLRHPDDRRPVDASVWEWLRETPEARYFLPGAKLPWGGGSCSDGVLVAPIFDFERSQLIGGICLSRHRQPGAVADLMPAVQSLAAQVSSALHSAEVYAQSLAHQRVEQELALAGRIQASFLPTNLPHVPGWQLAAALKPARETCGDFYDVIPLPNGRFGILIADVADKGMGAALYMALSRTLIRTYAIQYHTRPDYVLRVANRRILMDTDANMFVTVFYGVLDAVTGAMTYCNAGHNPPFLLGAQGGRIAALRGTGMALGVIENATCEQREVQFAPGDALVLYTDGITEAQDARETFFGEGRLLRVARANLGRSAQEVQDALIDTVDGFVGDVPQFDDITVMVVVRCSTSEHRTDNLD